MIKRIFDIVSSSAVILVLLPFFIPIMIILRLTGEHEIFYVQNRVGKGGKIFGLLKFATMLKDSPKLAGGDITMGNDPRVLPMGKFLRKTKINELPQLFNILKGDISVVGPRPLTPTTFSYYPENVKKEIVDLKPGLTGIGSIVFRDEESVISGSSKSHIDCYREDISPYKGELELWYKKKNNFFVDLLLIFLTAWVIVFSKSSLYEKIFKDLPPLPAALQKH